MSPIPPEAIQELDTNLSGVLLVRGDDGFDQARAVWNDRFRRSPDLIARCASTADVARSVRFARDFGVPVAVKGGGHSYAGNTVADGGLLIELGLMDDVRVDPTSRTATVGAGARWAAVDAAAHQHGLATPGGTVSSVGVAGFTLGGGGGWLSRMHGLAVDNLLSADLVTADGRTVRAAEDHNEDLFWALRGGCGNFGVVTSFVFRLHPVEPEVATGQVFFPASRAREVLRFYRDHFVDAPDELMCYPFLLRVPPLDVFPAAYHGTVAVDLVLAWFGPGDEAKEHFAPFRALDDSFLELIAPQSYLDLQQSFDAGMGPGNRWYSRAVQFDSLTDEAIDALLDGLDPFPGALTTVYLAPQSGAPNRRRPDATAFPHRTSEHELHIFPGWTDEQDDGQVIRWADGLFESVAPHGNGRVYVNLLGDGERDRTTEAFAQNLPRLRQIKAKWDPDNVFRHTHNVLPATG